MMAGCRRHEAACQLPPEWREWHRQRLGDLLAVGMRPMLARKVAAWDARGRVRAAAVVGIEAAMAAFVIWKDQPDGSTRWFLTNDPDGQDGIDLTPLVA
jgi:hypothetical protein